MSAGGIRAQNILQDSRVSSCARLHAWRTVHGRTSGQGHKRTLDGGDTGKEEESVVKGRTIGRNGRMNRERREVLCMRFMYK